MSLKAKKIFLILAMANILSGCTESSDRITFEENSSLSPFEKLVSEITIVPLEDDDTHLLGDSPNLFVSEDGFILSDAFNPRIYRYASDGRFMNIIGASGRGPTEYIGIDGVQILGDEAIVYSPLGEVLTYKTDGTFVERTSEKDLGDKTWKVGNGYLTYNGYGSVSGYKAAFISDGETTYFMPSDAKVLHLAPRYNIFCEVQDGVTFIDSYTNDIYLFSQGEISEYRKFDFGKFTLPDDFYEFKDSFAAAEMMMSRAFAIIQTYQESGNKTFVDVMIQSPEKASRYYGIAVGSKWNWFSFGDEQDVFAGAATVLDNGILYCVLDPSKIETFPDSLKKKLTNPEVLETVSPDSNYLIACIHLKN